MKSKLISKIRLYLGCAIPLFLSFGSLTFPTLRKLILQTGLTVLRLSIRFGIIKPISFSFPVLAGASILGFTPQLQAGPAESTLDPKSIVIEDAGKAVVFDDSSRWSVSGGATVRSIDTGFSLDAGRANFNWSPFVNRRSGRGDRGLFDGGRSSVLYDDGRVGPDYGATNPDFGLVGDAVGIIRSSGQIGESGRADNFGIPISQVSFHTEGFDYHGSLHGGPLHISDTDTGVGPYVQVAYQLKSSGNRFLNLVSGWSFVSTDHGTGYRDAGQLAVVETRTRHTYNYDFVNFIALPFDDVAFAGGGGSPGRGGGSRGASASSDIITIGPGGGGNNPGNDPLSADAGGIIYDVATAGVADGGLLFDTIGYQDPRSTVKTTRRVVTRFYAVSHADLDVDLNEIPFGIEYGCQCGPVDLFLRAGATLNIINYELENGLTWYQQGRSAPVARQYWRDSGTPVKVGLYGGIGAKWPLTSNGRVFLEANGSYRWVDSVHASAGIADVEIDVSSWEGRFGIGIILD